MLLSYLKVHGGHWTIAADLGGTYGERFTQGLHLVLHVFIGTACLLSTAIFVNSLKITTSAYPKARASVQVVDTKSVESGPAN